MHQENRSRVLIADGDEQVLMALERLLEDAGMETSTTWSARQALAWMLEDDFDVLLVGDNLPDMGCEQMLREIQRQGVDASIVVMESANLRTSPSSFASLGACRTVRRREFGKVLECVKDLMAKQMGKPASAA